MMRALSSAFRTPCISGRTLLIPFTARCCARVSFAARRSIQTERLTADDVWKAWQFGGSSIDSIVAKHKATRETVFQHLVVAIEAGKPIDWAMLCKDVGLDGAIACEVYKSLPKSSSSDEERFKLTPGIVRRLTDAKISKEQIRLCVLMLERGFSLEDIKVVICLEPGYFANETERLRILCEELQKSRKIRKEFFRDKQGQKVVLDQGLMDLLRDKNGATLVEIAAFFSDCDPKQLVELLYKMEKSGNISIDGRQYKASTVPNY